MARHERAIEMARAADELQGVRYDGPHVSGGCVGDGRSATCGRLDLEARSAQTIAEDAALIDEACNVLYGADGRGGVRALYDPAAADIICWRWCCAMDWRETAECAGYSVRRCQELAEAAFDRIDALGFKAVVEGRGEAEG